MLLIAASGSVWAQDPGTPDTVRVDTAVFDTGNRAAVNVYIINDQPLSGIQIPLAFTGDLAVLDSVTFGPRTAGFTGDDFRIATENLGGTSQTVMLAVVPLQSGSIAVGSDEIATLYFSRNVLSTLDTSFINATTLAPAGGLLAASTAAQPAGYAPRYVVGSVRVATSVAEHPDVLPREFELLPNYPNPFNPTTSFAVALPVPSHVTLEIYNLLGQRVVKLFDGQAPAGYLDLTWDGRDARGQHVGSGVYFYKVETQDFRQVRKMVLLK
jgi:hypothetical protein